MRKKGTEHRGTINRFTSSQIFKLLPSPERKLDLKDETLVIYSPNQYDTGVDSTHTHTQKKTGLAVNSESF